MPSTFADVWRSVKLHASAAPTFLVREWVNDAWKQITRLRPTANYLRANGQILINTSRAVAVTVTQGSATVTSAGLFVAGDLGRQFRIAPQAYATIITFTDVNTIVLDRVWGDPTAAATALILDAVFVVPVDFGQFDVIADPYNQRRLAFWITEDQLNILDPTRQTADNGPRLLSAAAPSPVATTLGRMTYEYWPRPTAQRAYPYTYYKQGIDLTDATVLTGVLGDAEQTLRKGALAQCARWPGTADKTNPYFNLSLGDRLQKEFELDVQHLSLRDDDQQGTDLAKIHWERWPLADLAYNDQSLRATDASIADLY